MPIFVEFNSPCTLTIFHKPGVMTNHKKNCLFCLGAAIACVSREKEEEVL